jgi:hypothetical protein
MPKERRRIRITGYRAWRQGRVVRIRRYHQGSPPLETWGTMGDPAWASIMVRCARVKRAYAARLFRRLRNRTHPCPRCRCR